MGAPITKSLTKYVYDKDRNVFCKLFCSRIEKEYPNLTELRKEIGDMVYDIDLVEYSPTQKELKDLHIDKLRLSSDYLESIGHYDPSFYDTCIKNNHDLKYYECLNSEIVTYDLKQLEMQNVSPF